MWSATTYALTAQVAVCAALAHFNGSQSTTILWEKTPGVLWNDSYVIGNGYVGASVLGKPAAETIAMNHEAFWSGQPLNRTNQDALRYMNGLQSEISNGQVVDAETLAGFSYAAQPVSTRHYEPLSQIEFNMEHDTKFTNYIRYLNLTDSITGIYYEKNGTQYTREYLASNPHNVIAIHVSTNVPGGLNFHVHQRRQLAASSLNRWEDYSHAYNNDTLIMTGQSASRNAIEFATGIKGVAYDGKVFTIGDTLLIRNATQATIYFSATTSFRQNDPETWVLDHLNSLKSSYDEIRSAAISDYQKLHQRVDLSLGTSSPAQRANTTSQRLASYVNNGTFDPELISLYFQFGRYLLIGSSRIGGLPSNLQGIWNNNPDPFWGSKYTTNINLQVNRSVYSTDWLVSYFKIY
jgi:alpha-L-fucosidase 2